jgi:hypothetical protein
MLIEKREMIMNYEVDMPMIANYGAYHADREGRIVEVLEDHVLVLWDGFEVPEAVRFERIRNDFAAPKGSPIGIFVNCYEVA